MKNWTPSAISNNAFEFLLTDVDTALTFMDLAKSTDKAETRQRNHANARRAYDTVVRLMQKLSLDDTQRAELNERLAVLRSRLQAVGQQF